MPGPTVIERGWLSANQVVFGACDGVGATVVDTGFASHAEQTAALIAQSLRGEPLTRIVNTHLHSDHCGGNARLQALPGVQTWIPAPSLAAVRAWNHAQLSYHLTDQQCPRFAAEHALVPGSTIRLGAADWQIHAAPGHDMDAVMLFEPQSRVLISGDALWEERLAIIFPELAGERGFDAARATLDLIERLAPRRVVPGHGPAFEDVGRALAASRERIRAFEAKPDKHLQHAARSLLMFHMLEVREGSAEALADWMLSTPIFRQIASRQGQDERAARVWAQAVVSSLVDGGALQVRGDHLAVPAQAA